MKKIVVGGLLAALVLVIVSFVFGSLSANMYVMSPAGMWKSMMGQRFFLKMVIYDIVVGLILSYVYSILKSSVPGSGLQKGVIFGLLVWLVGSVPGLGMTFLTMNIRNKLLIIWLINGLVNYVCAGAAVEFVDEKI